MKAHLLILMLLSIVLTVKPMKQKKYENSFIPPVLKEMPPEIISQVESITVALSSIEKAIDSLHQFLALPDKEFIAAVLNQEQFKSFFERIDTLDKIQNFNQAIVYIDKHPELQKYSDLAEYLHKKFPDISNAELQFALFGMKFKKIKNPIEALRLVYDNRGNSLVQKNFPALLNYLHEKFPYLDTETLRKELEEFDPELLVGDFSFSSEFLEAMVDANLPWVFSLLFEGVDPNTKIRDESGAMVTPLQFAIRKKYTSLIKLLRDVGAKE